MPTSLDFHGKLFLAVYIQSDESTISHDVLEKIGIFAVHVLSGLVVCIQS